MADRSTPPVSDDKLEILSNLESLINQTYVLEKEYKELSDFFHELMKVVPVALWVFEHDGSTYFTNDLADAMELSREDLLAIGDNEEREVGENYYLFRIYKRQKVLITATDNTEQRRHERLISMGQMAAHLAHEIRNPVGSVSILTSTLFHKVDTRLKPIVLEMKKGIWRVERIIKATLLFSKGVTLNLGCFYLDEMEDELNLATANYSYSKEIAFDYDMPHTPVTADFDLLSMVLQNMIFNAIDAIEDGEGEKGTVKIHYHPTPEGHEIHVVDDGKDFEDKEILFEAFKSTKTKGNGLGLALSRQIVEAHGGKIELHPEEKGFIVRIGKELS